MINKLLWLAVPAMSLAACHKAPDVAPSDTASDAPAASDSADLVTPASGMPTMVPSDPASPTPSAGDVPTNTAATYLTKAGAGDLFEIESSRAILKTTQDPEVRGFAQMMIADHHQSTAMLVKAAKAAGVPVPAPHLLPEQQKSLDGIKAATGKGADQAYLGEQRTAHAAALILHKGYAANGDTPQLKAAAAQIVPVVQHHLAMLDKIH